MTWETWDQFGMGLRFNYRQSQRAWVPSQAINFIQSIIINHFYLIPRSWIHTEPFDLAPQGGRSMNGSYVRSLIQEFKFILNIYSKLILPPTLLSDKLDELFLTLLIVWSFHFKGVSVNILCFWIEFCLGRFNCMKCALLKLCTTNVLTVNRSSPTQIKTQLQSNITEGGNCDICNSKLTETILHLCCRIILYWIFLTHTKHLLFKFPFNFKSLVHPLIYTLLSTIILFHEVHHPIHLKWTNELMNAIKLWTPKYSFSVCSVQVLQCHCSGVLPMSADRCIIFCRLVYFISFPSSSSSLTHLTRSVRARRAQDSGQCAQLSYRVASESAGCDLHLARVIIRLSYMGIIRCGPSSFSVSSSS